MEHMNTKECAEYLGVHYNTVRRYVHEEGLPVLKFPGRTRFIFRKDLVDEWVYERSQPEVVIKPMAKRRERNEDHGKLRVLMPD